jgi:subtilisin family serine protease
MTRTKLSRLLLTGALLPLAGVSSVAAAQTTEAAAPAPAESSPDDRPIVAMGGPLAPNSGGLNPLKGMIRTFSGDLGPFVGNIRTFEGAIDPSVGNIRTFQGDIDPYVGNIRTFWGTLTPTLGELDPKVGNIRTFSDEFLPQSRDTLTYWANIRTFAEAPKDYATLAGKLNQMVGEGESAWGAQVLARTGKTFRAGFADAFLAKHGVNLSDPASLSGWDAFRRQSFMLDWYDNLLNFSGIDRVDHWMNAINWTPKLTQTQGGGLGTTIGLVDFFVANDADVKSKISYAGGYTTVDNAHGAAVISLIVASHDGKGVMGIAPGAKVAAFNPFDATQTASWADVKTGMAMVASKGASVINLSLGVPGHTLHGDWRDVFRTSSILNYKDKAIYVIAAGNDGITQTVNVNMKDTFDNTFLVVGSVDANRDISAFSNKPGTACLTEDATCKNTAVWNGQDKFRSTDYLKESGLLMNRFLVAPGEMILVSDGAGGVTRMSGTSFAAPLVSGAIALLHDRWPWLKNYPREVAKILLESAQDLGAPGVDPVYGHGLLDIDAAQSALNFDAMKYYLYNNGSSKEIKVADLKAGGVQSSWATNAMFFTAFEKLDLAERDFLIPLSSRLFGTTRNGEYFQEFMYHHFMNWMGGATFAPTGGFGFSDSARTGAAALSPNGWSLSFRGRREQVAAKQGASRLKLNSSVELTAPGGGLGFAFGSGDGAALLAGQSGLQMSSDFDPRDGGANPFLGFASGGGHIATRITVAKGLNLTVGATHQDRAIEEDMVGIDPANRALVQSIDPYRATAGVARIDYQPAGWLSVSAALTRLDERRSFLGVRSLERSDFGDDAISDAVTVAADIKVGGGISLFGSATAARSHSDKDAALQVRGARSTAFQAGLSKAGLFGGSDQLRLTLAQPLTVERGHIDFSMIGVVDRETGEKGVVTQRFDIGAPERRRYVAEALYGAALWGGRTELNLFGRGELRAVDADMPNLIVGGSMLTRF